MSSSSVLNSLNLLLMLHDFESSVSLISMLYSMWSSTLDVLTIETSKYVA